MGARPLLSLATVRPQPRWTLVIRQQLPADYRSRREDAERFIEEVRGDDPEAEGVLGNTSTVRPTLFEYAGGKPPSSRSRESSSRAMPSGSRAESSVFPR